MNARVFFYHLGFIVNLENLSEIELLALLSASSVLRKKRLFELILKTMIEKEHSFKKIYEALLQTYLFAGFPSALIALKKFGEIKSRKVEYSGYDIKKYSKTGVANCRAIYGKKYDKLISNVQAFSPELADWLIVEGYGKVLGRKGLTFREREVCIVSILTALKYKDQLYSHLNGAVRLNAGVELLRRTISNLEIISAKPAKKFGLRLLNEYLRTKKMIG